MRGTLLTEPVPEPVVAVNKRVSTVVVAPLSLEFYLKRQPGDLSILLM